MRTLIVILLFVLSGCASTDYNAYLQAQQRAFAEAVSAQKPLVEIEAEPGQDIRGLRAVRIYTPVQAPQVQQARPSEWAATIEKGLGVVGTVLGIKYATDGAVRLSDSVGRGAAAAYPYVQTPQANVNTFNNTRTDTAQSQSIGGNGVLGSGTYGTYDATSIPTVVTQPPPVVVTQPPPVVVTQPPPVIVPAADPLIVYPEVVTP
ncbi:hypothetical protein AGMMS50256_27600 [Betaproteobacteria bacterium]|nr:hypothetical protein AGMMS50256_27600 [Betaproteobacteria bacterium]